MNKVTLTLNGERYTLACGEGEESHMRALAAELDARLRGFARPGAGKGDARPFIAAALQLLDENHSLSASPATGGQESEQKQSEADKVEALALRLDTLSRQFAKL